MKTECWGGFGHLPVVVAVFSLGLFKTCMYCLPMDNSLEAETVSLKRNV
jgi:hypothetical protein